MTTRSRAKRRDAGFTMLEVLVALAIATIGLLGTLAVQQTVLLSMAHSQDAQVANHLAAEALETVNARIVSAGPPARDQICPLLTTTVANCSLTTPMPSTTTPYVRCACVTSGGIATPIATCPSTVPSTAVALTTAGCTGQSRFYRQITITNPGVNQPYRASIWVAYSFDGENTKQVRIDAQRYKPW